MHKLRLESKCQMKRKKKRWKRKKIKEKKNNIDAYGPRTPDTENNSE